jgi:hypothetical protein
MKSTKTISSTELARLSGLSVRWLRELGEALPKPKTGGGYLWPEVFRALVDHYRHAAKDARLDPLQQVRRLLLEDTLKKNRAELLPVDDVRREVIGTTAQARSRLMSIAGQCSVRLGLKRKDVETIDEMIRDACRELESRWEKE